MTFYHWLRSHQSYREWYDYMRQEDACQDTQDTLKEAWRLYVPDDHTLLSEICE